MSNLISNVSFFPVVATAHDEDLIDPFGMTIIDGQLWVADHGASVLTHHSATGIKLAPTRVTPLASSLQPQLNFWVAIINANIAGLPLDNNNLLIALGMPVQTFVQFRNQIQAILNKQISTISQESSSAIFKVFLDYQNAANPLQTLNDINTAVASFTKTTLNKASAPVTAVVANLTQGFPISWIKTIGQPPITAASYLIAVTANGVIFGFTPLFKDSGLGIVALDRTQTGGHFTGAAIANNNLYVTDLFSQKVLTFDNNFSLLSGFTFSDEDINNPLPAGYVPYNIVNINGLLYVVYGKINAQSDGTVKGPGHGFISIFDPDGQFIQRFTSQGPLNSPYSVIIAPPGFGSFAGQILVGNQGDGLILAYNLNGTFKSTVNTAGLTPFKFPGLNGLATDGNLVYVSSSNVDQFGFTNGLISTISGAMVGN